MDTPASTPVSPAGMRIDKWLWAVRLYRTRSLAIAACQAGHVKINGRSVKPAREIHVHDLIEALTGRTRRLVKVLALLDRRVGAKVVSQFMEDLTPPEEKHPAQPPDLSPLIHYPKGWGRPTKKKRRQIDDLLN